MRHIVVMLAMLAISFAGKAAAANPYGVAVIIGNTDYVGVVDVDYAHRDADAFHHYAVDVLGYDPENILDLRDATKAEMEAAFGNRETHEGKLWSYLHGGGQSDVLVFYSGHGVPSLKTGRGYLLPVDADPNFPEINGYPIDLLYENLAKLDARGISVFIDACFSGESQAGMLIHAASPVFARAEDGATVGPGTTVLTAASGQQLASWDTDARHGLFTRTVLEALYGAGDSDADGTVTAGEVKAYLDWHMTRAARRSYGRNQTATLIGATTTALSQVTNTDAFTPRPSSPVQASSAKPSVTSGNALAALPPPTTPRPADPPALPDGSFRIDIVGVKRTHGGYGRELCDPGQESTAIVTVDGDRVSGVLETSVSDYKFGGRIKDGRAQGRVQLSISSYIFMGVLAPGGEWNILDCASGTVSLE